MKKNRKYNIAIIGIGYVGLPLAVEFGKKFPTIGYDVDSKRIQELQKGIDRTLEVEKKEIKNSLHLIFSNDHRCLLNSNIYIITVPTPIYKNKSPDLTFLKKASKIVAKNLRQDDIVIYESTVYPGLTEQYCVPILEKYSRLTYNKNFFCGYSPERINPGDKNHKISEIKKITSGSNAETRDIVDKLYSTIIKAGTHSAPSIKVAEAAKVIENTQRDLNIALINEFSILFSKLNINTNQVLEAAKTKWNFLDFTPGLVGGHCIGVDPYYLTYVAKKNGYNPNVILSGRKINDDMYLYVYNRIKRLLPKTKKRISLDVLFFGLTFKENCPDTRNSQTLRLIRKFSSAGYHVHVYDPLIDQNTRISKNKFKMVGKNYKKKYDILIGAVAHDAFLRLNLDYFNGIMKKNSIVFDIKGFLPKKIVSESL